MFCQADTLYATFVHRNDPSFVVFVVFFAYTL